ncbi:MAG: B12-binding domain-containing protein, partial [Acidimicrobiia bacterium]|nr:B12-binding domain-containing protein [Acidimicrobiia bacterium]
MPVTSGPDRELTITDVADRLGVHYMTAYRYVRLGLLDAHQRGRSWVVTEQALADFQRTTSTDHKTPRRGTDWPGRLTNRMLAGDEPGAWSVVEAAQAGGMEVPQVYLDVVVPALFDVGERWHRGDIDVAGEHTASRIADRIIARLGARTHRRGARRGTVVLGSTATEQH